VTVGLLGGAFDPPHLGHVALARAALDRFALDRIVALVAADPGHKRVDAPADARLRLAEAAFAELPLDVELDGHARTVDLLREGRWADPLFLVGADEFCDFMSWKEPDEVLRLARLAVATRPGFPRDRLDTMLARLSQPDRVEFFEIPPIDASSTEIRRRVAAGEAIDDLVPPAVAALVRELDLYRRYTGARSEGNRREL
jgi:nicotinate-nucleotide adenylyltransferase